MSNNPLENIPVTESNNNIYNCPPKQRTITRFGKKEETCEDPVSQKLYIPTALAGDVVGPANCNEIKSINGLGIIPNYYPKKGQVFMVNDQGKLELGSIARIKTLSLEPRNGLTMEDNVLGINCTELVNHCGLITLENANETFLTIEGGQVQELEVQNLTVSGDLVFEALGGEAGETTIITIDETGVVSSRLLPDVFDVDLSTKANINGDNINVIPFKTALSLQNVNNTSDADKPVSDDTQTALDGKVNLTGDNISVIPFKTALSLQNVNNTSDTSKPVSAPQQLALNNKANINGDNIDFNVFKTSMNLDQVDNTSDADKPVSDDTQTALDGKANDLDVVKLLGNQTISDTKTFEDNLKVQGTYTDDTLRNPLSIIPLGDTGSLSSTGGALFINNTSNTGTGLNIYTNKGLSNGHLFQVKSNNPLFDRHSFFLDHTGTNHAFTIINRGTEEGNTGMNVVSQNENDSAMFLRGRESDRASLKITHEQPISGADDSNAAAINATLTGATTSARNIYTLNEGDGQIATFRIGTEASNSEVASIENSGAFRSTVTPTHPNDLTNKSYVDSVISGGGAGNVVLTDSNQTISDIKTFDGNVRVEGTYSDTTLRNPFRITPLGDTGNSTSIGGALLINNTGNVGSGLTLYSDQATPTGHLAQIRTNNAGFSKNALFIDYTGSTSAFSILNKSTTPNSPAINVSSINESSTSFVVNGIESSDSTIKVKHTKPSVAPSDATSSSIKILVEGTGTLATNIYATNEGTGKFATFRTGTEGTNSEVASIENSGLFRSNIDPIVNNDLTRKSYVDTEITTATQDMVESTITGISGATSVSNIVQISQADYDALGSYDANTLYAING